MGPRRPSLSLHAFQPTRVSDQKFQSLMRNSRMPPRTPGEGVWEAAYREVGEAIPLSRDTADWMDASHGCNELFHVHQEIGR